MAQIYVLELELKLPQSRSASRNEVLYLAWLALINSVVCSLWYVTDLPHANYKKAVGIGSDRQQGK